MSDYSIQKDLLIFAEICKKSEDFKTENPCKRHSSLYGSGVNELWTGKGSPLPRTSRWLDSAKSKKDLGNSRLPFAYLTRPRSRRSKNSNCRESMTRYKETQRQRRIKESLRKREKTEGTEGERRERKREKERSVKFRRISKNSRLQKGRITRSTHISGLRVKA